MLFESLAPSTEARLAELRHKRWAVERAFLAIGLVMCAWMLLGFGN